jgi:hypothetical protein
MIHNAKGLICGFNTTVLPETLHEVPDIVKWTVSNIHKVCTNTLIPVRVPSRDDPWDLYVDDRKIDFGDTVFASRSYKNPTNIDLSASDIYTQVLRAAPEYRANAFLGGTIVSDAPKWLFGNIIGCKKKVFGPMGPKSMEIIQNGYHFLKVSYHENHHHQRRPRMDRGPGLESTDRLPALRVRRKTPRNVAYDLGRRDAQRA